MRRFAALLVALMPLPSLLSGCEDGPNQTYSPAPNGAPGAWNGPPGAGGLGDGGAFVGNGTEAYDASWGGTNANDLCTPAQQTKIWNGLFQEPVLIPGLAGGIDMAGGPNGDGASGYVPGMPFNYDPTKETWTGATVEQAEKILCTGTADVIYYGLTNTLGWGNGCAAGLCELSVLYNTNSRIITDLLFQYGYIGTLSAKSKDGKTTYSLPFQNVPLAVTTSSGTVSETLNWSDSTTMNPLVNGMYDALRATYEPTFPADNPQMDPAGYGNDVTTPGCIAAGHCVVGNNLSQGGYWFFTSLNLAMFVNSTIGSQAVASTFTLVDLGVLKLLPFSNGSTMMKLDTMGIGSTTTVNNIAGSGKTCVYQIGMTFKDFDSNCLEPLPAGDPNNTIAKNKLFGAMAHSDEAYEFDINGIDPQFVATLAPTAVISDAQRPGPTDTAYELNVDQYELGTLANDWVNNDSLSATATQDLHGLGLITLEWANLLQHYMQTLTGVTTELGDPRCLAPNSASAPAGGAKCSGLEGIETTAPNALLAGACTSAKCQNPNQMQVNALGYAAVTGTAGGPYLATGLKPGTWYAIVCNDAGGLDSTGTPVGYGNCEGGPFGYQGQANYYFDTLQDAVLSSYPTGTLLTQLPTTLASRRFFFQQWILAVIKYLQTADNPSATLATIDANVVDANNLFFDSAGGGFETAEYVFRNDSNSAMQDPTDLEITTNLTTAVINNFDFQRYNFRGEKALYTAMRTTPTDWPGYEPLYVTNIVGSPVLQSTYGTYACAINKDPLNAACGYSATTGAPALVGPVDALGNEIMAPYSAAFGHSVLGIAAYGQSPSPSAMTISPDGYELISSAMVTLPIWSNPFDPTTATPQDKTISVLLPYLPRGAGVGFPVTIDGSRDKFYNTYNVDFSGTSVDGNLDYEYTPVAGGDGGTSNNILVVRAFETQNYIGMVFPCEQTDPVTGQPDVLSVRMYANEADILSWIAKYPGSIAACNIQIKYSIYGNYADYISFLQNGVRLGLNPGFGGSVVSDVTLFDPNVVASLGQ